MKYLGTMVRATAVACSTDMKTVPVCLLMPHDDIYVHDFPFAAPTVSIRNVVHPHVL